MVSLIFHDIHGERHDVDASNGSSLMEVAYESGVAGILGDCGGTCSCATCHAYIDGDWFGVVGPPQEMEGEMLEMAKDVRPNSRLLCQIEVSNAIDGIEIVVANN